VPDPHRQVLRRGLGVLGVAVREEPRIFTLATLGGVVNASMLVGSAVVLGRVTDEVIVPAFAAGRTTAGALATAAAAIFGVAVLRASGTVVRRLGAGIMQYRLQASYRRRVTRQYLRLPIAWHQRHPTGQLLSNAGSDIEATWYPIAPFPLGVAILVLLVIAGIALLLNDVVLALVAFVIFPLVFVINLAYQRRLSPLSMRAQQLRAEVSEVAHESFDGALVVKTLGREAAETERFARRARELRDVLIQVGRVRGMFDPAFEALPNLGVLIVLLVGTVRVSSGSIDPGDLVEAAYLFTLLAFPIRAIGFVLGELPRSVVGWDRVTSVLEATGALPHGSGVLERREEPGRLQVEAVSFRYDSAGQAASQAASQAAGEAAGEAAVGDAADALHDVSFDVHPGETVAVVGPTGSGKSTLTTLLVRLVDPRSGHVQVDGVDLRSLPAGGVSDVAALVPQQTFLFDDTVRGNVTLGSDATDDEVWEALRLAQADRFVAALPQGLETRIGERGTTLSGGQRQRLALARALIRKPRLLVLDDATSSVDTRVEGRILAGLRDVEPPSTVVVIAYRKATISLADDVVYIEHGRVIDRGTHATLLDRCSGYRRLVTAYERAEAERLAMEADQSVSATAAGVA
jgi:ATP-binding cassette, subfamily B, bacterial